MPTAITDQQREQVECSTDDEPAELYDPATEERYRLVPAEQYERLKDEADQAALRRASARALGKRLAEEA